jgi:hypothetical protein
MHLCYHLKQVKNIWNINQNKSLLKDVWLIYETKKDVIRNNCSTIDMNHIYTMNKELYFDKFL